MSIASDSKESSTNSNLLTNDLTLVKAVTGGSVDAWHGFLNRYSGLIYGVIRRHLVAEENDDIRAVHVDVLHALYHDELVKYRGDVRLTTWLIVYTRSRALDFLRQRHGRYRVPEGYEKLTDLEKNVLQLHFIKRMPLEITLHALEWSGYKARVDDVVQCIEHIEEVMDRRYLLRLDRQPQIQRSGADSAQMLKCLVQLRLEFERKMNAGQPDDKVIERESRVVTERLQKLVASLTPREREIVDLRFKHRLTAKEIAEKLKLDGQRRAYTLIDKVIRKLRQGFQADRQL